MEHVRAIVRGETADDVNLAVVRHGGVAKTRAGHARQVVVRFANGVVRDEGVERVPRGILTADEVDLIVDGHRLEIRRPGKEWGLAGPRPGAAEEGVRGGVPREGRLSEAEHDASVAFERGAVLVDESRGKRREDESDKGEEQGEGGAEGERAVLRLKLTHVVLDDGWGDVLVEPAHLVGLSGHYSGLEGECCV